MESQPPRYAVYHRTLFWLVDTCAGGTWSCQVQDAIWFESTDDAWAALHAADMDIDGIAVCRVL